MPERLYRGEGKNLGYSAVGDVEWWAENPRIAGTYGKIQPAEVISSAKSLRLVNKDGTINKAGYDELADVAKRNGVEFNKRNAMSASGEELFSDDPTVYLGKTEEGGLIDGRELMAALRKEGYQIIHTDNIEGAATMVLDKSAITRGPKRTSKIAKPISPAPSGTPTPEQPPSVAGALSPEPTRTEPPPVATPAAAVPVVLTETTSSGNFASKRKVTQEGLDRVEAARQALRDIINNPDITGPARSDAIENGKNLIAFLDSNADTRRPLDEGYNGGDRVAYTGEDAPDGFRAFIRLDGYRAGSTGVERTPEAKAADVESAKKVWNKQQAAFREIRESGKSDQMPPSRKPTPAPSPAPAAQAAVPKLREGQKQGDLLGGSEDLTLVGERVRSEAPKPKGPEPTVQQTINDALDAYGDLPSAWEHLDNQVKSLENNKANKAAITRLNAAKRKIENTLEEEARRAEMEQVDAFNTGLYELESSIKELGGIAATTGKGKGSGGELSRIAEARKGAFLKLFRKNAPSHDTLREGLEERGFQFATPDEMFMALEDSMRSGKKLYGSQFPEGYTGGPGAMGPVERAYMEASRKVIGASKEIVTGQRAERGLDPLMSKAREANPVTWDAAVDRIEKDPGIPARLVEDIHSGEKKSTSREEKAELLYEMTDLTNKLKAETERSIDESSTPAERAEAHANAEGIERQLRRTEEAARMAGSDSGAALQFMQVLANEDYTFAGLMRKKRKLVGNRDITANERAAVLKEAEAMEKKQKEIDAGVEETQKQELENAVDSVLAAAIADREAQKAAAQRSGDLPYHPSILARAEEIVKGIEAKRDELRAKVDWRKLFGSQSGAVGGVGGGKGEGKPMGGKSRAQEAREARAAAVEYLAYEIAAHISRFGVNRAKTLEVMLGRFDDSIKPFFGKAYDAAQKIVGGKTRSEKPKVAEAVKTGATAPEKQPKPPKSKDTLVGEGRAAVEKGEGLHNVVAQIVDGMIDAGNRDRADIFKRTTKIVQEFMPEATERDVNRAYVDYGKKKYPNPDEAAAFKRKTRQAVKIEEDIARLKEKMRPELQGYQREKLDLELRDLVKRRSELLKDPSLPQEPGAFASKDEAKQTRISNRIEELDRYLKTGEKPVEGKPTQPDSAKTEQMRAEKEALEAYVREVDAAKNPPLSDAQKALDAAMIARERAGQTLDDISTGKVKDPAKIKEALTQLEEDVRLETEALKALAAEMRRDAKPKGDPGYLKEQAQIKALERAIASYEKRVANADFAAKGKVQGPDSQRVTQLKAIRDLRRAAYKAARDAGKPVRSPEDRYNDTRLNAMKRREEDLKARAARQAAGDFSKRPKPVTPALRRDVLNKKAELQKMKDEIDLRQKEYELSQQPAWQKGVRALGEARGIILGGDLGVLTRQGAFAWSRPINSTVAAINATKAMFSPEAMGRWEVEMRERVIDGKPVAPIRKEHGLQTTDTMSHPEELVISRLLSRMPDIKIGGKTVKASVFFKGLERFQTTFINDVRMRTFDTGVRRGYPPDQLKLLANFINSATGRSNAKMVGPWMSAIFTSPRYERSRWEMIGQPVRNVGALVRSGAKGELNRAALSNLKDMAVTAAGAYVLFQLAESAGGYKVNWDPESSDFLKMRKGDEVWDVTAGLAPRIRDLMRIYVGFSHPDYKENWINTGGKMLSRTINPALKTPAEQLSIAKQRYEGVEEPKSPFTGFKSDEEREGLITLAPLIIQSMKQAMKEDGLDAAVWAGAREFIGSSVSRYPEPEQ
jgi:hypothetical protein